ncbi:MAG: tetratricopeptide repeat protein [Planctomycetaceae bacterium]|nr:tetratricopeptide repeat protein [Planctomycetaceae bacterium]
MTTVEKNWSIHLLACIVCMSPCLLYAQGSPRTSRTNTAIRTLETKAQEAQQAYVGQLGDLAKGYEESGNIEQAEETLRQILRIAPDDQKVKDKLTELREKVFNENQQEIEVEASKGWVGTRLTVTKGEPVRIEAQGSYKFIINSEVGPEGFAVKDVAKDMGEGIPAGALMGTVFSASTQRGKPPQAGKPFLVGTGGEFKPDADGILFLRLNVPAGSKCIGKVKVVVTGNFAAR